MIKYHPDVDIKKSSVMLEEALAKSLDKIEKATEPSKDLAAALARIKKASQPSEDYLKALEQIKKATEPSRSLVNALATADRLKRIIKDYEKE